jgi:hypothetical protein
MVSINIEWNRCAPDNALRCCGHFKRTEPNDRSPRHLTIYSAMNEDTKRCGDVRQALFTCPTIWERQQPALAQAQVPHHHAGAYTRPLFSSNLSSF